MHRVAKLRHFASAYDTNAIIGSLRSAVTNYDATIGPHNGGSVNPNCSRPVGDYQYWHWGPDEALDIEGGSNYASASVLASFGDIETWLTNVQNGPRVWAAPYFNATREDSYGLQEQLGIKISGDQKLSPFPHWTLSTRTDGKRYSFLSEPVSDWFVVGPDNEQVYGLVAQSLERWHPPWVHSFVTLHNAVDFYYGLGALINVYSHSLSTGHTFSSDEGDAGYLVPDYILYCTSALFHPRTWAGNAKDIYQWWLERSPVQISATYTNSGGESITAIAIAGPHTNTAVEVLVPGRAAFHGLVVHTNSGIASTNDYRVSTGLIKVRAAGATTTVQVHYVADPTANDDTYVLRADYPSVRAPGVLANDYSPGGSALTALLLTNTPGVTLSNNGGFSCSATGRYTFTYRAHDSQTNYSPPATVNVLVAATNAWYDDFTRAPTNAEPLAPWVDVITALQGPHDYRGGWIIANGVMMGAADWSTYAIAYNTNTTWTNYSVEARIKFEPGAYGGGIGGRVAFDPATTNWVRYAAWIYPEGSPGGSHVLKLAKFSSWTDWGYGGSAFTAMDQVDLGADLGTNWHRVALTFRGSQIDVYYDSDPLPKISMTDGEAPVYLSGGISLDMYNWVTTSPQAPQGPSYNMSVDHVVVTPLQ